MKVKEKIENAEKTENIENNNLKLDFPFYNENPKIGVLDIIVLLIPIVFFTIYTFLPDSFLGGFGPYVFCGTLLGAFLIAARGKISLIVKKPKLKDFGRVLLTLILQYVFAIVVGVIIQLVFKMQMNDNAVLELEMGFSFWIAIIVQLFGEELYKIIIFLLVLTLMNKLTKKRTLSIVVATIFSLFCFAMIHFTTYNNIVQILLLQGAATIFCMYNYLKTKNILTSYLQHFLLDAIPFILVMTNVLPD